MVALYQLHNGPSDVPPYSLMTVYTARAAVTGTSRLEGFSLALTALKPVLPSVKLPSAVVTHLK